MFNMSRSSYGITRSLYMGSVPGSTRTGVGQGSPYRDVIWGWGMDTFRVVIFNFGTPTGTESYRVSVFEIGNDVQDQKSL